MKIVVVISDDKQISSAGVRIRYHRLAPHLKAAGHTFELAPIDTFGRAPTPFADVVIFSKCHDARAVALAGALRSTGVVLGVDVFDDYYSDLSDPRFVHLREWFRALGSSLDFCLCATTPMHERLRRLLPQTPSHVMNDPSSRFDSRVAVANAERNLERALRTGDVDVCWFGIGDNPHFRIGLTDLHDFAAPLAEFARAGLRPRLSILTNRRALDVERLEMISRLPVPWHLEEWSERLETEIVAESLLCFLPVRCQAFSVVKSLNRAITALTGGSQVLSSGFPLYRTMEPFVYRKTSDFIADMTRRELALRADSVATFGKLLESLGSAEVEADRLISFLQTIPKYDGAESHEPSPSAIVHGRRSTAAVHKFAQRRGDLSVASPFAHQPLNFDVRFEVIEETKQIAVGLSNAAVALLNPDAAGKLMAPSHAIKTRYRRILVSDLNVSPPSGLEKAIGDSSTAAALMRYQPIMAYVILVIRELFGEIRINLSETESPFLADVLSSFVGTADFEPASYGS